MAAASCQTIAFGPFDFDAASGLLYRGEREILLPMRVGRVLEILLQRPGEVLSKDELLGEVWKDAFVGEDSLTQAISMVRSALEDDPRDPTYIQTIPKRGYRFIAEVTAASGAEEELRSERVTTIPETAAGAQGGSVGHYEILAELGSGAMGVVYRARDTVLEREVAIKVLPEDFLSDPDRAARFEREAKLLAAVSHPNIASIHSLEEQGGTKFPVMELVEGETLEQRLRSGPIKVEETLEIARQIASALEAAHERDIVHRDLKPANIKLTPSGQVKVLDFGLAKDLNVQVFGAGVSESPTESITIMGSRRGSIVGTAAYMSPEQARGQEVNKQADIWAFGCVLYEMLTGRRPFEGDTVSDTIASLLGREPDWDLLPQGTPPLAQSLLRRCLSKDPDRRLHDVADARIEIEETITEPEVPLPGSVTGVAQAPLWRRALPWSLVAVMAVIVSITSVRNLRQPAATLSSTQIPVAIPPGLELEYRWDGGVAISPDGQRLAYVARPSGERRRLYTTELGGLEEAREISGTEGPRGPFFSPDGNWLGFFQGGDLMKVAFGGGEPLLLHENPFGDFSVGGAWGPDDTILFTMGYTSGIWRVSADGGEPSQVTAVDPTQGETEHGWPVFLPGGTEALFTNSKGNMNRAEIVKINLETGEKALVHRGGFGARYSPTGHLVFGQGDSILAASFDLESAVVTGAPTEILDGVRTVPSEGFANMAISDKGVLAYISGGERMTDYSLVLVDREGSVVRRFPQPPGDGLLRFAPGGQRVVTSFMTDDQDVWVHDLEHGGSYRLTTDPRIEWMATVSSDGKVAFSAEREGGVSNIYWKPIEGGGSPEPLVVNEFQSYPSSFSDDGRLLAYREVPPGSGDDIWIYDFDDPDNPREFIATEFREVNPMFSPDGRWLAYQSYELGTSQIFVVSYPEGTRKRRVSTTSGRSPRWAPDGRELFYISSGGLWAVSVQTEPELEVSGPRLLFGLGEASPERVVPDYFDTFDVAPDGEHFLMRSQGEPEPVRLHLILDWFEEIERLVPTGW